MANFMPFTVTNADEKNPTTVSCSRKKPGNKIQRNINRIQSALAFLIAIGAIGKNTTGSEFKINGFSSSVTPIPGWFGALLLLSRVGTTIFVSAGATYNKMKRREFHCASLQDVDPLSRERMFLDRIKHEAKSLLGFSGKDIFCYMLLKLRDKDKLLDEQNNAEDKEAINQYRVEYFSEVVKEESDYLNQATIREIVTFLNNSSISNFSAEYRSDSDAKLIDETPEGHDNFESYGKEYTIFLTIFNILKELHEKVYPSYAKIGFAINNSQNEKALSIINSHRDRFARYYSNADDVAQLDSRINDAIKQDIESERRTVIPIEKYRRQPILLEDQLLDIKILTGIIRLKRIAKLNDKLKKLQKLAEIEYRMQLRLKQKIRKILLRNYVSLSHYQQSCIELKAMQSPEKSTYLKVGYDLQRRYLAAKIAHKYGEHKEDREHFSSEKGEIRRYAKRYWKYYSECKEQESLKVLKQAAKKDLLIKKVCASVTNDLFSLRKKANGDSNKVKKDLNRLLKYYGVSSFLDTVTQALAKQKDKEYFEAISGVINEILKKEINKHLDKLIENRTILSEERAKWKKYFKQSFEANEHQVRAEIYITKHNILRKALKEAGECRGREKLIKALGFYERLWNKRRKEQGNLRLSQEKLGVLVEHDIAIEMAHNRRFSGKYERNMRRVGSFLSYVNAFAFTCLSVYGTYLIVASLTFAFPIVAFIGVVTLFVSIKFAKPRIEAALASFGRFFDKYPFKARKHEKLRNAFLKVFFVTLISVASSPLLLVAVKKILLCFGLAGSLATPLGVIIVSCAAFASIGLLYEQVKVLASRKKDGILEQYKEAKTKGAACVAIFGFKVFLAFSCAILATALGIMGDYFGVRAIIPGLVFDWVMLGLSFLGNIFYYIGDTTNGVLKFLGKVGSWLCAVGQFSAFCGNKLVGKQPNENQQKSGTTFFNYCASVWKNICKTLKLGRDVKNSSRESIFCKMFGINRNPEIINIKGCKLQEQERERAGFLEKLKEYFGLSEETDDRAISAQPKGTSSNEIADLLTAPQNPGMAVSSTIEYNGTPDCATEPELEATTINTTQAANSNPEPIRRATIDGNPAANKPNKPSSSKGRSHSAFSFLSNRVLNECGTTSARNGHDANHAPYVVAC